MNGKKTLCLVAALLAACTLGLNGCSKKTADTTPDQPAAAPMPQGEDGMIPESLDNTGDGSIMEGRTSGPMVPVYFEFDSSSIKGEQVSRIETNADFLRSKPEIRIRVEGNCDPRGTREYNLALGERRAQSAKNALISRGVAAARMNTISFGEEKLLLFGQDEYSWAQNRRDDFVIIR